MVKEVISRCDKCGALDDVQEFTITLGGQTKDVDLCPEHAKPILELFELGHTPGKPTTRKGRSFSHAVVAIEDTDIQPR